VEWLSTLVVPIPHTHKLDALVTIVTIKDEKNSPRLVILAYLVHRRDEDIS
jgi:hypothetical protein